MWSQYNCPRLVGKVVRQASKRIVCFPRTPSRFVSAFVKTLLKCSGASIVLMGEEKALLPYLRALKAEDADKRLYIVKGCVNVNTFPRNAITIVFECEREEHIPFHAIVFSVKCPRKSIRINVRRTGNSYIAVMLGEQFVLNISSDLVLEEYVLSPSLELVLKIVSSMLEEYGPVKLSYAARYVAAEIGVEASRAREYVIELARLGYITVRNSYITSVRRVNR